MWRYQAVYRKIGSGDSERIEYSICEVYLDDTGKMEGSTESPSMTPYGESLSELIGDLKIMLSDAEKWKAVDFDNMQAGMSFELAESKQEIAE